MKPFGYHGFVALNSSKKVTQNQSHFRIVFKEAKQKLGLDDETDGDLIHTDPAEKLRADVQYMLMEYRWRVGFGYTLELVRPYIRKEKRKNDTC